MALFVYVYDNCTFKQGLSIFVQKDPDLRDGYRKALF